MKATNAELHNQLIVNRLQVKELKVILQNTSESVKKEMLGMFALSAVLVILMIMGILALVFSWKNEFFSCIPAFLVLVGYLEYSFVKSFLRYGYLGENIRELIATQESAIQQAEMELNAAN